MIKKVDIKVRKIGENPVITHINRPNTPKISFLIRFVIVFIRIRWIGTGSHPYEKTMSSIVLYPVFYEYRNVQS